VGLADEPGSLGKAARKLAGAGINLELVLSAGLHHGKAEVVLAVSDPHKAASVLGDLVVEG
jgi:hypothetical protein